AYVTNFNASTVSVIATATNTVMATVPVGMSPNGVAVTPDGKHAYVTGFEFISDFDSFGIVSVIDTATNTVVTTLTREGSSAESMAIVPPPPGIPFLAFNAKLQIQFGSVPNHDAFGFGSNFTLSSTAPVINPVTQAVALQIGTFAVTIPAGSFTKNHLGDFVFSGVINGVTLKVAIAPTGTLRYNFQAGAQLASLTGTENTVYVTLAIGGDSGATSVTANIFGTAPSVTAEISH
ncbi:MAG: hypothetical protein WA231_24625, partial [Methylocella sp.]